MSDDVTRLERRLARERLARKEAEELLEQKSLELYDSNIELKGLNEDLENKVLSRTKNLKDARDDALALSKAKSDFLSNMSHELRTPMNGILGAMNLLLDSSLDKAQAKLVNTGIYSGKLLLQLINDILDLSKLDADKLTIESVSFNPVVLLENVIDSFALSGQTSHLAMESDISPKLPYHLMGDPLRILQIVTNIISNAVKFTKKGSVHLHSFYDKGVWYIAIKDTGVGMSEAQQATIFEEFTQADVSTTRNFGGTGLGLNISKKLLALMEGNIKLTSKVDQGSIFQVEIPILADSNANKFDKSFRDHLKEVILIDIASAESDFIQRCLSHWDVCVVHQFQSYIDFQTEKLSLNPDILFIVSADIYKLLTSEQRDIIISNKFILITNTNHEYQDIPHVTLPIKQTLLFERIAGVVNFEQTKKTKETSAKDTEYKFEQQLILLVEDNAVNQQIAKLFLSKVNLNFLVAGNGQEAVEMVQNNSFDLILMDIQMPIMDGITATKTIRALSEKYASIPILAMTANCFQADIDEMIAIGMNGHISKPIVPPTLYSEIKKHINVDSSFRSLK